MRRPAPFLACLALGCGATPPVAAQEPPVPTDDPVAAAEIRQHTTDPRFCTPLVDHLPAHPTVPSPRAHLGYTIGTPGRVTSAAEIHAYCRALDAASDRVRLFGLGVSDEGREMLALAIGEPEALADLDANADRLRALGDPRGTDAAAAEALIAASRPVYWITAGLHSTELGPPEVATELAYRLAVEESPLVREIRRRIITLITPVLEADGRERQVDWSRRHLRGYTTFEDMPPRSPPLWGHYTYHDNNRDGLMLSQRLTQQFLAAFQRFRPVVSLDMHESVPLLYVSTGTGPYNPAIDPLTQAEWQWLATHEVARLQGYGLPGVWTWGFYDGWAPSYLLWIANLRNATGRFFETFGNGTPETVERRLTEDSYAGKKVTSRQWYRGEPPPKTLRWSMRDNVNYMESGALVSLEFVATHAEQFLRHHRRKCENAVRLGRSEKPHAFVIPTAARDRGAWRTCVDLLLRQGLEVHRLDAAFAPALPAGATPEAVAKAACTAGDCLVRLDQPWRPLALALLDVQKFPDDADLPPYDDVGWTLGLMLGVDVRRIDDPKILDAAMTRVTEVPAVAPTIAPTAGAAALVVPDRGQRDLGPFRFALGARRVEAAEAAFTAGGTTYPLGSLVIPLAAGDAAADVRDAATRLGLEVAALPALPDVARHVVDLPRVALVTNWVNTQDTGWLRYALDTHGIPYTLIDDARVRAGGLKREFDVCVYANQGGRPSLARLVHGHDAKWGPLAYTKTDEFPSHGVPLESADITGGMGFPGLDALRAFLAEGGVLVACGSAGVLPAEAGLCRSVSVGAPPGPLPGSVLRAKVRRRAHPLAYGYEDTPALFRAAVPLYEVARHDERFVVIQWGTKPPYPPDDEGEGEGKGKKEEGGGPLVLSGGYKGFDKVEGKPAVLDVPVGSGRVIFLGPAIARRYQDHVDFRLLWNALLHWNDLPAPEPADERRR